MFGKTAEFGFGENEFPIHHHFKFTLSTLDDFYIYANFFF